MHRSRPNLKNGVDLQLQAAFSDGNWPTVIRLAEKRVRMTQDPYFDVVKVVAESQLDDPVAKYAAVTALWQYVGGSESGGREEKGAQQQPAKAPIRDVNAIDLLEWATCPRFLSETDYPKTIGQLRLATAKAASKDSKIVTRCLESCLLHWDLVNAQQIAAVLDRSFPQDEHYVFWSIAITHLLASSSQVSVDKKKLYGTLAQKQIERLAQAAEQSAAATAAAMGDGKMSSPPGSRAIRTQEQMILYYDIVETHGSHEDYTKLLSSPLFGPVALFRKGSKNLLGRAIDRLKRTEDWKIIYDLCLTCLSEKDEDGNPNFLGADWLILREFIGAAKSIHREDDSVSVTVRELLLRLVKAKNLKTIYRRNILLARVAAAFALTSLETSDVVDGKPTSTRLKELLHYANDQCNSPSCFDDIKQFLESLDVTGLRFVAGTFASDLSQKAGMEPTASITRLLSLQFQLFVSTCVGVWVKAHASRTSWTCAVCNARSEARSCADCLKKTLNQALRLYKDLTCSGTDKEKGSDVAVDLAMLMAHCYIQLAFPNFAASGQLHSPSSARYIIHAILILEHQASFSSRSSSLPLLLSQLHLFVGSVARGRQLWDTLDVKRTIVDSLAPIFYDRLSTVCPEILTQKDADGWDLIDQVSSHYENSLKLRMPRRFVEAFESGSYGSVLAIPRYIENLTKSATRVLSLVEEVRSERLLHGALGELFDDPRYGTWQSTHLGAYYGCPPDLANAMTTEVARDATNLTELVDYGSFPSYESRDVPPIYARIRLGPPPSNCRMHLSLLAEGFHNLLGYRPPANYKVVNNDVTFVLEMMQRISNSFAKFLPRTQDKTTEDEITYFNSLHLLTSLALVATEAQQFEEDYRSIQDTVEAIKAGLDSLRRKVTGYNDSPVSDAMALLSSLHSMTMLHDTAAASKHTVQWILDYHAQQRQQLVSSAQGGGLKKDLVSLLKSLQNAAEEDLKEGEKIMSTLNGTLGGGFEGKLKQWLLLADDDEAETATKTIIGMEELGRLVGSWKECVKGWQQVKWQ